MNDAEGYGVNDSPRRGYGDEPRPRAVGSPLPVGNTGHSAPPAVDEDAFKPVPPGRALANPSGTHQGNGLDRAISALRMAIPFVQKILPLLDGNIGTAVSNILTSTHQPPQPQMPPVDLEPIEHSLADLRTQHRDLRVQLGEQNTSLKRVEDQLEMVREATDRNTLEQQELLEDLKAVGNKVNVFAVFALALLAVSILVNVILYLHIRRVLP